MFFVSSHQYLGSTDHSSQYDLNEYPSFVCDILTDVVGVAKINRHNPDLKNIIRQVGKSSYYKSLQSTSTIRGDQIKHKVSSSKENNSFSECGQKCSMEEITFALNFGKQRRFQ